MPWKMEPKKDVTTCDKSGGAGSELRSRNFRMGKPNMIYLMLSISEYIAYMKGT